MSAELTITTPHVFRFETPAALPLSRPAALVAVYRLSRASQSPRRLHLQCQPTELRIARRVPGLAPTPSDRRTAAIPPRSGEGDPPGTTPAAHIARKQARSHRAVPRA